MDTLLPTLRPASWPDRAGCWSRPLLPLPEAPLLTVTQQVEPLLVTLGPERLAHLGLTPAEAEARAIANLARLPARWRALQSPTPRGGWLDLQILQAPLAASRILDTRALADLGRQILGAETLAIGLPRSDLLLVTPASWALETDFSAVVRALYDGSDEPLSARLWLADRGVLVGSLS